MTENGDSGHEFIQFPSLDGVPRLPPLMTIEAVRLLVQNMLDFAANSPESYFDVGPVEQLKDGRLQFDFLGRTFVVTVEATELD